MKKLLFLLVLITFAACKSSQMFQVSPVKDLNQHADSLAEISTKKDMKQKQGVYYALPRTNVIVKVSVRKTDYYPGPYAEYASRYLGIDNVIDQSKSTYDILDIKISTHHEPDPQQFYFVEFLEPGDKNNKRLMLELTESGLLANVNNTSDFDVKTKLNYSVDEDRSDLSETFKYFPDENLYERVDTIIQEVTRDTVTIKKRILKRKMVEKSMEQKAQEAAEFILKVREQRMKLITGYQEISYSRETMEYMYDELEKIENDYLKLFTGLQASHTMHYRYTHTPLKSTVEFHEPLFYFSKTEGVKEAALNAEPVYLHLDTKHDGALLRKNISINDTLESDQANGFYYRMPQAANIKVYLGEELKAEAVYPVSQFGTIHSLPAYYDKIRFYPSSGMIKTIDCYESKSTKD